MYNVYINLSYKVISHLWSSYSNNRNVLTLYQTNDTKRKEYAISFDTNIITYLVSRKTAVTASIAYLNRRGVRS